MIISQIRSTIEKHDLFAKGEHILIGVSGGPDSVFLLYALAKLQKYFKLDISVAHLNHCLRARQADADEEFTAKTALALKLPYYRARADVKKFAKNNKYSVEQAARVARYNFFLNLCRIKKINKIVLAHTKDDQVETVLMRLIRGTGIKGLGAMRFKAAHEGIPVVRPLLEIEKNQIISYLRSHKLKSRTDESNFQKDYFRNKIRLDILPLLLKENPGLKESIARLAFSAQEADDFIRSRLKAAYARTVCLRGDQIMICRQKYLKLMPFMQKELIRKVILELKGDLNGIDFKHIDIADRFIRQDELSGKKLDLPKKIKVSKTRDYAGFFSEGNLPPPEEKTKQWVLELDKKLTIKPLGYEVLARRAQIKNNLKKHPKNIEYLDLDKLEFPLTVRTRKPGDSFWPLGAKGKKKLKKFFIDQKVDDDKKDKIPLVLSKNKIISVAMMRIADQYKVTSGSKAALKITFKKLR